MATTSVKLTGAGKADLDRLQAKLVLLGYKFTKEQILEFSLRSSSRRLGDLIAEVDGGPVVLSEKEAEKLVRKMARSAEDWGPTSWRDIDAVLYGWKKR